MLIFQRFKSTSQILHEYNFPENKPVLHFIQISKWTFEKILVHRKTATKYYILFQNDVS